MEEATPPDDGSSLDEAFRKMEAETLAKLGEYIEKSLTGLQLKSTPEQRLPLVTTINAYMVEQSEDAKVHDVLNEAIETQVKVLATFELGTDTGPSPNPAPAPPPDPFRNPMWPKQMVVTRVLTQEEQAAIAAEPALPELNWRDAVYLALEMVSPFRVYKNHDKDWHHYDYDPDETIEHAWFVQAHESLPYVESDYCNYIYLTRGHESELFKSDRVSFGLRYFDLARDFIRECALNGYEASYG